MTTLLYHTAHNRFFPLGLAVVATLGLMACTKATQTNMTYCTGAEVRRQAYEATILAADVLKARTGSVPESVYIARQAAVFGISVLDRKCVLSVEPKGSMESSQNASNSAGPN